MVVLLHVICILFALGTVKNIDGSTDWPSVNTQNNSTNATKRGNAYGKILDDARHYWNFDISGNLFWISDRKTGVSSKAKGNGAKLIQAGLERDVNYLRLKGTGSRLHLGYFYDCSTAVHLCKKNVTVSLWLRFRDNKNKEQYFLGNLDPNTKSYGYSLMRTSSGMMNISVSLPKHAFYALYPTSAGSWEHHVFTIYRNQEIDVYLNSVKAMRSKQKDHRSGGKSRRSISKRDTGSMDKMAQLLTLGRVGYTMDADYDEVVIWDKALTNAQVKTLYKGGLTAPSLNKKCRSNPATICVSWPALNDPYKQIIQSFVYFKAYTIKEKRFDHKPVIDGMNNACIENLEPLRKYTVGLYIRLRNGESLISKMIICETKDGVPSAPTNFRGKGISSSTIQISWKTPKPQKGKITHYQVTIKNEKAKTILARHDVRPHTNYEGYYLNISNLRPSVKYQVGIRSVGKLGRSGRIHITVATQTPVPTEPAKGLTITQVSWNEVKLTWMPLAHPDKFLYTYEISYQESGGKPKYIRQQKTFATIKNLKQLTSYLFDIRIGSDVGFGPSLKKKLYVRTKDRNECSDNWSNLCDINAKCFNTEGSYLCQCNHGYFGNGIVCRSLPEDARQENFCEAGVFRNIFWPKTYQGDVAVTPCPRGTAGFATRRCLSRISLKTATFAVADLSQCVSAKVENIVHLLDDPNVATKVVVDEMANVTESQSVMYGGDIKTMVNIFGSVLDKKLNTSEMNKTETKEMTNDIVRIANNLLGDNVMEGWTDIPVYPKNLRTKSASYLLESVDGFAGVVASTLENRESYSISLNNVEMMVQRLTNVSGDTLTKFEKIHDKNAETRSSLSLALGSLKNANDTSNLTVSFLSFKNADLLLLPSRNRSIEMAKKKEAKLFVNSGIISATIHAVKNPVFNEPVVIIFPHLKEESDVLNTSCSYWSQSDSGGGDWLSDGCRTNYTNATHTICHCDHLTNFAVLMSVSAAYQKPMSPGHQLALRIITYLGLFISLLALFLALFAFSCFRFMKSARTIYHRHLIIALILAHLLFLVGIERTETKIGCTLIAVFLHYFFLVAFVWMAMEGVLLYFMLTKIFNSRKLAKRKIFYFICWLLPAFYVAVLASIFTPYYGTGQLCWLSARNGFSWAFVGPVLIVIAMNIGFMVKAFKIMAEKRKGPDDLVHDIWYWMKGCLVLSCVLGVTWIIGIFYIDSNTLAFAYIFNILNALQGLFIFIFHCVIDSRVRSEFLRILKCQARSEYNEKAGYSSSMRFRNWSTTKSSGSLDRSTLNKGPKRINSDSTQDNHKPESNGRQPFHLKAVPESEEPKRNGKVPEAEPLLTASDNLDSETASNNSKCRSSILDGDVFLDDPTEHDLLGPDIGRISPIDSEIARKISEASDATLEDIVDILEGKKPSSQASVDISDIEEEPRSPYDKIERSMEELVISLGEEEERIESETSENDDRQGLLIEVDATSTQSSLSAEMSLSDEETESSSTDNDSDRSHPNVYENKDCDMQSHPTDLAPPQNLTFLCNPKLPMNNNTSDPLDISDAQCCPTDELNKPDVTGLVYPQTEQTPCYVEIKYQTRNTKQAPANRIKSHLPNRRKEPDLASELQNPDVILPYKLE